jgi:hypothetical protein
MLLPLPVQWCEEAFVFGMSNSVRLINEEKCRWALKQDVSKQVLNIAPALIKMLS